MKQILILFLLSLVVFSCKTQTVKSPNTDAEKVSENPSLMKAMRMTGVIKVQGVTSYQYGTHIFISENKTFALRSKAVVLNDFIGKKSEIVYVPVAGYPISGGPDLLKVLRIKIIEE